MDELILYDFWVWVTEDDTVSVWFSWDLCSWNIAAVLWESLCIAHWESSVRNQGLWPLALAKLLNDGQHLSASHVSDLEMDLPTSTELAQKNAVERRFKLSLSISERINSWAELLLLFEGTRLWGALLFLVMTRIGFVRRTVKRSWESAPGQGLHYNKPTPFIFLI